MSASGQKRTYTAQKAMSALPPIATANADFRTRSCPLYPQKQTLAVRKPCPLWANSGLTRRSKNDHYSITSSARDSNEGETESPMAFAVFKLMTNSNLVGCCTGRSAGSMPRRILST